MKSILLALLLSTNVMADECSTSPVMFTLKSILNDHLLRRAYEENIYKTGPMLADQVYILSTQNTVTSMDVLIGLRQLNDFYATRLNDSFQTGEVLNVDSSMNELNTCLSEEKKNQCSGLIQEFRNSLNSFSTANANRSSNLQGLASMVSNLNAEAQSAASSRQIFSSDKAYQYIQSFDTNWGNAIILKKALEESYTNANKAHGELSGCIR